MKQKPRWLLPIWTISWKCVLFIIIWGALDAIFIIPFADQLNNIEKINLIQKQLYFDATGALSILVSVWIMLRFIDRRPFLTIGFAPGLMVRDLILGVSVGISWLGLSLFFLWILNCISWMPSLTISWSVLGWVAVALIFNTLTQKVLVHSYIFQTIQSQANYFYAIMISAILFMALHAGIYTSFLLPAFNVFFAGVLFGVAYYLSGNLWLPIAIHFTWNFLLGPVLGLPVSGQDQLSNDWRVFGINGTDLWTGGSFGIEGGLVVTVSTVIVTTALVFGYNRKLFAFHSDETAHT
jgi:uncharacterized protein